MLRNNCVIQFRMPPIMRLLASATIGAFLAAPAFADFVGEETQQNDTAWVTTPWDAVVADYNHVGYTASTFQNQHGNTWNVWQSNISGNTLIWSKTNAGGRGEGFNCHADSRPNYWARCQRYDLATGQPKGRTSLTIRNGVVIDR